MRRQICWQEKGGEDGRCSVRVTIHGGTVKWQFKRSGSDGWDYDTAPTPVQWDHLEEELRNRYRRGRLQAGPALELVQRLRAGGS